MTFANAAIRLLLVSLAICIDADSLKAARPEPTAANVPYGPHERQVLDFWQAYSEESTPLVVFIHGGGFRAGKKENFRTEELNALLESGISFASVNYRFIDDAALPASLHDCRRALQFCRSKAGEWNIDKARIGGYGGSAGAMACMYLAYRDDMISPSSDDPIAKESTRLACVAAKSGQATFDLEWWRNNLPGGGDDLTMPVSGGPLEFSKGKNPDLYRFTVRNCSALNLLSSDDPPTWLAYSMAPEDPVPEDGQSAKRWRVHHVAFGVALKKAMDNLGVEAHLVYPKSSDRAYDSPVEFFRAKLKPAANHF